MLRGCASNLGQIAGSPSGRAGQKRRQSCLHVLRNRARGAVLGVLAGLHVGVDRVVALEAGSAVARALQQDFLVRDPNELELGFQVVDLTLRFTVLTHQRRDHLLADGDVNVILRRQAVAATSALEDQLVPDPLADNTSPITSAMDASVTV